MDSTKFTEGALLAAFTQTMLLSPSISQADATDLVNELCEKSSLQLDLAELVTDANLKLQPFNRKIHKIRHPYTEGWVYTLTCIGDLANLELRHDLGQGKFMELIPLIFNKDRKYEFRMEEMVGAGITEQDFTAFLSEGWLEEHREGLYIPSTRLLIEGEEYLAEHGAKLHKCLGCSKYVLFGRFCENLECDARVHARCDEAFRHSKQLDADKCPKCESVFLPANNKED